MVPLPRLIGRSDWITLERGLLQRLEAIDCFLADIYGPQQILNDGVIPREDVESSSGWRPQMQGISLPLNRWCHISGLDLIRDGEGTWRVLEDNLRCPSGVAYFLENRRVMKRLFPGLFEGRAVQPIDAYPSHLIEALISMEDRRFYDHGGVDLRRTLGALPRQAWPRSGWERDGRTS